MGANPLSRTYQTQDGRVLWFTCLQAGKYWPTLCRAIGHPEWATDPRFADHASLMTNSLAATELLNEEFAGATLVEWRQRLATFDGQWAVMQDTIEAASDPQTVANGYVQECQTSSGVPFKLATAPVQFDQQPAVPHRAPELNEHGDAILEELGFDGDAIVDLKIRGVVA
jgi:crotonobetainyl-CoA:carnitine CoA-transferase CaiB-like acyl-CoA transferase